MKRLRMLRNTLLRKPIYAIPVLLVTVTASSIFTASPASAVGSQVCEANGNKYCINAPTLALYDPVIQSSSGRSIYLIWLDMTKGQLELQLAADTKKCVAAANNGHDVVLHKCSGGNGVVWIEHLTNGPRFESREFSGKYLAGDNVTGHQFQIRAPVSGDGFLYVFEFM